MHLTLHLTGDLRAPMTARRAVDSFADHVSPATLEVVSLVVNELVTNALLHACMDGEPIHVELESDGGRLWGHVVDPGKGFEVPTGALEDSALSGRGLILVDRLASRWGVEAVPSTRVWFEIEPSAATRGERATG